MSHVDESVTKEVNSMIELGKKIVRNASGADCGFEGNEIAEVTSWVTRLGQ
jgi:hypothetical protein